TGMTHRTMLALAFTISASTFACSRPAALPESPPVARTTGIVMHYQPDAHVSAYTHDHEEATALTIVVEKDGKTISSVQEERRRMVKRVEVLEREDGRPVRARVRYTKVEMDHTEDGKPQRKPAPAVGKTYVVARVVDGEPCGVFAMDLTARGKEKGLAITMKLRGTVTYRARDGAEIAGDGGGPIEMVGELVAEGKTVKIRSHGTIRVTERTRSE